MLEIKLTALFNEAITECIKAGLFTLDTIPEIILDKPKREEHGDLATNVAMIIASKNKRNPLEIAQAIACKFPKNNDLVEKIDIAKPGFINLVIHPSYYLDILNEIITKSEKYGRLTLGQNKKVQVEFVSANPTGPLHIGHGRGAVYGDVLANVLKTAGYDVTKEYYVNNAGVQILTLGRSIYLRYQELQGKKIEFPEECYQGSYIIDIARYLLENEADKIKLMPETDAISYCGEFGGAKILDEIKTDLQDVGVEHDLFFYENRLHTDAAVDRAIQALRNNGYIEEKDGAVWFKSSKLGDDKDRVLQKSNGDLTYFATDIAYHKNKYDRGFERVIDILGADHAGYVERMKGAVEALGYDRSSIEIVLIQLVNLVQEGEVVSMSTRSATYETLRDVLDDVGKDVCRYFFLMRSHNAQLDFDLKLAKKETAENPVFYIQYAHARIASVFRKALEKEINPDFKSVNQKLLNLPEEVAIAKMLGDYPSVILKSAENLEPHRLAFYLLDLAKLFQSYYSKGSGDKRYMIISDDEKITMAKLYLLKSCQIVLQNALSVLGISAPEKMLKEEVQNV
ncbi:MAG: arginine--tRNA ligase [Deltaproteobacteria bacterium CG07_land_8_20_14_0_80_38_7]|nr:MAG: arginine--tRNA ligase [Deltaproteobacteria bacterium CG07_land_8_20_14_0_80_38_7]